MIIRKIYRGSRKIRRIYIGGKIVWEHVVLHSFTRGSAFGLLEADAGAFVAATEPTGGQLSITEHNIASVQPERVSPVRMIAIVDGYADAGADTIPTKAARAIAHGELISIASAVPYGLVWGRGTASGKSDADGSPGVAEVAPTSGKAVFQGSGSLIADTAKIKCAAGVADFEGGGSAGAHTSEPEQIRMITGGKMSGSAGASVAKLTKSSGQAFGTLSAPQAGAISERFFVELIIAEEDDGSMYLYVDGTENPLENVSNPEASGEDSTLVIQIN